MLTSEEAVAILQLIDRANISVKEAEVAVRLKSKLQEIAKPKGEKKKEDK